MPHLSNSLIQDAQAHGVEIMQGLSFVKHAHSNSFA